VLLLPVVPATGNAAELAGESSGDFGLTGAPAVSGGDRLLPAGWWLVCLAGAWFLARLGATRENNNSDGHSNK